MTQYAMVIDLQKCAGCGACALACKSENNTAGRSLGQAHNWVDYKSETSGKFPTTKYTSIPVQCNHCSNAPCVKACPVTPKAMYKTKDGITMHNDERCIGCRACQEACPYSKMEVKGGETSVISYNEEGKPYEPFYADKTEMIPGCTTSPAEMAAKTDNPPHRTKYDHPDYQDVRRNGITEKCIFCEHRVKKGLLPNCVAACPAKARTFGDLQDKNSEVAQLLKKYKGTVLKPEKGTKPNVYYIRSYSAAK
ncbi:MAG: 4Fe-4S dicluster domain-containing protein [Deltaproteobacteria bacterium]|jgi:Fe-S-cluster-containing dehydrogenase component|uniref:4Fe-4S dicluster domain-containing protein n=1 Tax=Hydrosulfovibrio ferrireducens TaxID=2934181 RepID=UPI00122B19FE|nr:MAG: 4Fe-4S dicluster domain-containing protein [Deltaproteobacteria bacterium]